MEPYREMIGNTGGNPIEELMNDQHTNARNNAVRSALIISVDSQIHLLKRLHREGRLREPGPEPVSVPNFSFPEWLSRKIPE